MQYSTNYNMNKPELNEQYRLSHWNDNTDIIDTELKRNADNIINESSRATNAETALRNITDSTLKTALLNFCYPIGSIYWSGVATNPHDLFGGTWVQIKDKFVWAKGDSDTLNDIGGEKTHTLSVNEMPSHSHTFSGNSVTTSNGGVDHVHGINHRHYTGGTTSTVNTNHTHNFTPSGSVTGGNHSHGGSVGYTDLTHNHSYNFLGQWKGTGGSYLTFQQGSGTLRNANTVDYTAYTESASLNHTHSLAINDSGNLSLSFSGNTSTTGASNGENSSIEHNHTWGEWSSSPRWWGNEGAERLNSDGASAYLHSHTVTASGSNSNAGGGNAHNNMPPYIVKYCWERTA